MPILSTDLVWYSSTVNGGMGFSTPWSGPGSSLGKFISTTPITNNSLDNLFLDVAGDENISSMSDYQCIFIANMNSSLTLYQSVVWIVNKVIGGTTISIAKDIIGPVNINSNSPQASHIPLTRVIPQGISNFITPLTKQTGIPLGDLPPQSCAAIWIQRKANNTVPLSMDGVTLRVEGGTTG